MSHRTLLTGVTIFACFTAVALAAQPATRPSTPPSTPPSTRPSTQPTTQPGARAYPLGTCIVSDEKLGEMGEPIRIVHEGQEVKFCCRSCVAEFNEAPAKYLKKLADAEKKKSK